MACLAPPDRPQEVPAEESSELQEGPPSESDFFQHAVAAAFRWWNAVAMQQRRLSADIRTFRYGDDFASMDSTFTIEIDIHFLLISLVRLRRAVGLAAQVSGLEQSLNDRIAVFYGRVPYLARLRNVGEHFDDYVIGAGRGPQVRRIELQGWSLGPGGEPWIWLGEEVNVADIRAAADELYHGFCEDVGAIWRQA